MQNSSEIIIEVSNLVTKFARETVHDHIGFNVIRGSIVALIGESGSGKTTLLYQLLRLRRPNSGQIKLFGQDIWSLPSSEMPHLVKRFGVLFQDGALFSSLTAGENVAVAFEEQTKLKKELISSLVQLKLALVGLPPETAQKFPSELSGGMRKRVGLARALALEPELLFLDEPTSGLDPVNARAFDRLILTLAKSLGLTVFMVTHDLDSLFGIVDRLLVIGRGKILADGPLEKVRLTNDPWITEYFNSRQAHRRSVRF